MSLTFSIAVLLHHTLSLARTCIAGIIYVSLVACFVGLIVLPIEWILHRSRRLNVVFAAVSASTPQPLLFLVIYLSICGCVQVARCLGSEDDVTRAKVDAAKRRHHRDLSAQAPFASPEQHLTKHLAAVHPAPPMSPGDMQDMGDLRPKQVGLSVDALPHTV